MSLLRRTVPALREPSSLAALGALIGDSVGGPPGGWLGWIAGTAVGAIFDPEDELREHRAIPSANGGKAPHSACFTRSGVMALNSEARGANAVAAYSEP